MGLSLQAAARLRADTTSGSTVPIARSLIVACFVFEGNATEDAGRRHDAIESARLKCLPNLARS